MNIVVSDSSPINLLVQLEQILILPSLFSQVIVPPEVIAELGHERTPLVVRQFIHGRPEWLLERAASTPSRDMGLDAGETAAITLALELGAALLIDERDGRDTAVSLGLEVIGAIGVLERAANFGIIADLAAIHQRIRSIKFHIHQQVLDESLQRHLQLKKSQTDSN